MIYSLRDDRDTYRAGNGDTVRSTEYRVVYRVFITRFDLWITPVGLVLGKLCPLDTR